METKAKLPTLKMSWRRQPNETGLRRVCQGPRGWDLAVGGEIVARSRPKLDLGRRIEGWYFYGRDDVRGVPLENTSQSLVSSSLDAISAAEDHFRKYLGSTHRLVFLRPRGKRAP